MAISTITPAQTLSERAGIFALNTYALLSKVNNQLPSRDIPEKNIIKPVFCFDQNTFLCVLCMLLLGAEISL
jgi:hypothetical protein